jgi:hypothetical protein
MSEKQDYRVFERMVEECVDYAFAFQVFWERYHRIPPQIQIGYFDDILRLNPSADLLEIIVQEINSLDAENRFRMWNQIFAHVKFWTPTSAILDAVCINYFTSAEEDTNRRNMVYGAFGVYFERHPQTISWDAVYQMVCMIQEPSPQDILFFSQRAAVILDQESSGKIGTLLKNLLDKRRVGFSSPENAVNVAYTLFNVGLTKEAGEILSEGLSLFGPMPPSEEDDYFGKIIFLERFRKEIVQILPESKYDLFVTDLVARASSVNQCNLLYHAVAKEYREMVVKQAAIVFARQPKKKRVKV